MTKGGTKSNRGWDYRVGLTVTVGGSNNDNKGWD